MTLQSSADHRSDVPKAATFHDEVRAALEERRADGRRLLDELAPVATPNTDPVAFTRMSATRAMLGAIEAALDRLDAGTYGVCVGCAGRIPQERLVIVPHTDRCVPCQDTGTAGR